MKSFMTIPDMPNRLKFPCLLKYDQTPAVEYVIMAVSTVHGSKIKGVVVWTAERGSFALGHEGVFDPECFKPFAGEITLAG